MSLARSWSVFIFCRQFCSQSTSVNGLQVSLAWHFRHQLILYFVSGYLTLIISQQKTGDLETWRVGVLETTIFPPPRARHREIPTQESDVQLPVIFASYVIFSALLGLASPTASLLTPLELDPYPSHHLPWTRVVLLSVCS